MKAQSGVLTMRRFGRFIFDFPFSEFKIFQNFSESYFALCFLKQNLMQSLLLLFALILQFLGNLIKFFTNILLERKPILPLKMPEDYTNTFLYDLENVDLEGLRYRSTSSRQNEIFSYS